MVEQPKIYDVDKVIDQMEGEKEYANTDYDDTFSQGMEKAIKILKREKDVVEKYNKNTRKEPLEKYL